MDWVVYLGVIGLVVGITALMFRLADDFGGDPPNKPKSE